MQIVFNFNNKYLVVYYFYVFSRQFVSPSRSCVITVLVAVTLLQKQIQFQRQRWVGFVLSLLTALPPAISHHFYSTGNIIGCPHHPHHTFPSLAVPTYIGSIDQDNRMVCLPSYVEYKLRCGIVLWTTLFLSFSFKMLVGRVSIPGELRMSKMLIEFFWWK